MVGTAQATRRVARTLRNPIVVSELDASALAFKAFGVAGLDLFVFG